MVVIAPKAPHGPGTVGVTHAATGVVPGTDYQFDALMDLADIQDQTLTIGFRLLLDSRIVRDETWTCGVVNRHGTPVAPFFQYSCPEAAPLTYRVEADLPRVVSIGLEVNPINPSLKPG